ncbi:MAG: YbbR-like domain-containing protein [Planctomycetota bacterium]|nr:YbbR-like domain-containing protein [Planctomycetota bacterium]
MSAFLRFLRAALLEDWGLKSLSLVLAILMWFYIDGELTDKRDFVVSMRPSDISLPPGYSLAPDYPLPKLLVMLRGPRRRLQLISADSIVFQKKVITNPVAGRNLLSVVPNDLKAEGFDILSVSPKDEQEPAIELVYTVRRLKRVRVKTRGTVRPGYVTEPGTTDPDQVNIEGKLDDLDALEHVWTEEVDMTNAEKDIVREVGIQPCVDVNGRRISFRCTATVRVAVFVRPEQVTKRMILDVRPAALPGTAMTVEPSSVEVEVRADAREFASPELKSNILLCVEWPTAWERPKDETVVLGPQRVQVRCFAPPGVQVRGLNGAALPTVEVRGAASAPLLQKK